MLHDFFITKNGTKDLKKGEKEAGEGGRGKGDGGGEGKGG